MRDAPPIYENDFVRVMECRHGTFALNTHDTFVGRSLELYGEWCESELQLLGQLLKKGDEKIADEWPELRYLAPAHDYKSRHGSVLLAFEAVEQALGEVHSR